LENFLACRFVLFLLWVASRSGESIVRKRERQRKKERDKERKQETDRFLDLILMRWCGLVEITERQRVTESDRE
jgi:hypothetical protein